MKVLTQTPLFAVAILLTMAVGLTACHDSSHGGGGGGAGAASALSKPTGLTASSSSTTEIVLQWTDTNTDEEGYEIQRSKNGVNFGKIDETLADEVTFTDLVPLPETTYYYRIRAVGSEADSPFSAMVSTATLLAPAALTIKAVCHTELALEWQDLSTLEDGYAIERSTDGIDFEEIATVPAGSRAYNDEALDSETDYFYRLITFNLGGNTSDYSTIESNMTPMIPWAGSYFGDQDEGAASIVPAEAGGYFVAGTTASFGPGMSSAWILRLDGDSTVVWQKCLGGSYDDYARAVCATSDGGCMVAGDCSSNSTGKSDFWVIKLSANGDLEWQKTYGGTGYDHAADLCRLDNGKYAVVGSTNSFGAGSFDWWILVLDSNGRIEWQKTYGTPLEDNARSVIPVPSGFLVAGDTTYQGSGLSDFWVMRISSTGDIQWENTYGGAHNDFCTSIIATQDNDFVVAGRSRSFSGDYHDAWVLKLDRAGGILWQESMGQSRDEAVYGLTLTPYNEIVMACDTYSYGAGESDHWIVKLDSDGLLAWETVYGGPLDDTARAISPCHDSGVIVTGMSNSFSGNDDFWVVKLDPNGTIDFNPASNVQFQTPGTMVTETTVSPNPTQAAVTDTSIVSEIPRVRILDTPGKVEKQAP